MVTQPSGELAVYHELRSALGLIAVAAQEAGTETDLERVRELSAAIERSAQRMLRLAHCLQFMDDPPARVGDTFMPVQALVRIVRDIEALGRNIELENRCPSIVCAAGGGGSFEALIHSVIGNCLDHADPAEPIRIFAGWAGGLLTVCIQNTIGTGQHRGRKMGSAILAHLARHTGASIDTCVQGDTYVVTILLPTVTTIDLDAVCTKREFSGECASPRTRRN